MERRRFLAPFGSRSLQGDDMAPKKPRAKGLPPRVFPQSPAKEPAGGEAPAAASSDEVPGPPRKKQKEEGPVACASEIRMFAGFGFKSRFLE